MTIIEKIKRSVEAATGLPFLYHAAGEINELIARAESLPVAFAFLLDSGTIDDVNGRYHERVTLAIMFADKSQFDFNAIENEQIIDQMKIKAYKWLQSLRLSNDLNIVLINQTQRLYDSTTDILTGFSVNITIEDVAGVGECELPEVVIDVDKNGSYDVVGVDKVRVNVVPKMEELEVSQNGEYLPPTDIAGFSKVSVDVQPVLEELTITQNGEYTPQEGIDGFRKVTAEFDTSSLPKVKVDSLRMLTKDIVNGTWNDYGYFDWNGISSFMFDQCQNLTHIDFAGKEMNLATISQSFYMCRNLASIRNLKVSNNCVSTGAAFHSCSSLTDIDTSEWDTSSITTANNMFAVCSSLQKIDTTSWDLSKLTSGGTSLFIYCSALSSIIGNNTIEDVLSNDIKCLSNIKIHLTLNSTILDRASLRAVINGLADLTGQTAQTLTIGATLMAKLTDEDIAIATNKNWTIV